MEIQNLRCKKLGYAEGQRQTHIKVKREGLEVG